MCALRGTRGTHLTTVLNAPGRGKFHRHFARPGPDTRASTMDGALTACFRGEGHIRTGCVRVCGPFRIEFLLPSVMLRADYEVREDVRDEVTAALVGRG